MKGSLYELMNREVVIQLYSTLVDITQSVLKSTWTSPQNHFWAIWGKNA